MMPDPANASALTSVTTMTMLKQLREGDATVWQSHVTRFRPAIVRFAQRFGLNDDDAEDAAQESLIAFALAYRDGKYDREKGRLRDWLFGIARNQILKTSRNRPSKECQVPEGTSAATGVLTGTPASDPSPEVWEDEWRRAVLQACLAVCRQSFDENTMNAFQLFARERVPAAEVAEQLGMTENAVNLAKRRVLGRIMQIRTEIEERF